MTDARWRDYVQYLSSLNEKEQLKYRSSMKCDNGTLYLDCWGLYVTGLKMNLTEEAYNKAMKGFGGSVNTKYNALRQKGKTGAVNDVSDMSNKATGIALFLDWKAEGDGSTGYDHMLLYIAPVIKKDVYGESYVAETAKVVDIGGENSGFRIREFDEWVKTCNEKGYTIAYGSVQ